MNRAELVALSKRIARMVGEDTSLPPAGESHCTCRRPCWQGCYLGTWLCRLCGRLVRPARNYERASARGPSRQIQSGDLATTRRCESLSAEKG